MDQTEVAKREDGLLTLALEKGVDTETLEKLIALRNAEIARQSKAEFDREFAKMQAEFVPVGKTNQANDSSGRKLYSYCPIEVILAMAAPIIAAHGFSYRWEEEALPTKEKRVWCVIAGYGHEERAYVDIPYMEPMTRATNVVQMRGSATTYGKRYSFLNATGIIVGGEDDDALSNSKPGTVKIEIVEDDMPPSDPTENIKIQVKEAISRFVNLVGTQTAAEEPYFTNEEKAFYKQQIAAINEGAKAEKDVAKGLQIKLADVIKLNKGIEEELKARQGNTPLANAVKTALQGKNDPEQKELY